MRANGFSPRNAMARTATRRPDGHGYLAAAAAAVLFSIPVFAGLTFIPDATFKGSSLNGWHSLGDAVWRAQTGEITGTVKPGGSGGWLFFDRSFQDVGFHAQFKCTGGCQAGVLVRGEKTADGYKGIYVSLNEDNVPSYGVTLDANGKELTRERLRSIGGLTRVAPPLNPAAANGRGARRWSRRRGRTRRQPGRAAHCSAHKYSEAGRLE